MIRTDPGSIRLLEPEAAGDAELIERLTDLINGVYATAESGLWRDGSTRTTATEVAELIRRGEIAVATREERIVGSVRLHDVADDASEFGLLVAAPDERNTGLGRALLDFVERHSRERGLRAVQLELLVPHDWSHPSKEFLKAWYGRRGYQLARTERFDDAYPQLAPLLATSCDLEIHEKRLVRKSRRDRSGSAGTRIPPADAPLGGSLKAAAARPRAPLRVA
jgi:GNAT superfamily N-acetyltransferase